MVERASFFGKRDPLSFNSVAFNDHASAIYVQLLRNKGLAIGSCPIMMVDNFSSHVDFLFTNPTKIII